MARCRSCLIPDTRPDTEFVNGQCTACINFAARKQIDWAGRKSQLELILEQGKNGSGYDCIVPSSGGKDSHYQVLTLLSMGARPLVVTATTCHLTPIGRYNIDNLARYATTIEYTPNRTVRAKLNRAGLEMVGDISYPEHLAIFSIPFQASVQFGIPLMFYGESPQREYGSPVGAEEAITMTRRWVAEFGGLLGLRPGDLVGCDGITERDMNDYMFPSDEALAKNKTTAYFLGQFLPWDSHANADVAYKSGMKWMRPSMANYWEFENLDNAMTGLHDHMMFCKYGYGRAAAQLSVDVRNGRLTRDQALGICREIDGFWPGAYAGVSIVEVLKQLNMSFEQLHAIVDKFTDKSLFSSYSPDKPILKEFAEYYDARSGKFFNVEQRPLESHLH